MASSSTCACHTPDETLPCVFVQDLYKQMALYGFADIQYVNQFAVGTILGPSEPPLPRWRVGVWTGSEGNILAVKQCSTDSEAFLWESPYGWDIADALASAIVKREKTE